MTRDDIIRMAREAFACNHCPLPVSEERIERFAQLVAAAEREACAKVCETVNWYDSKAWASDIANAIRARGQQ